MNARWALALVAVLAGAVCIFVLARGHRTSASDGERGSGAPTSTAAGIGASRAAADASSAGSDVNGPTALNERPQAPSNDLIGRDPRLAAQRWHARAEDVLRAKNRKEYGDEVVRLMDLPYDEAWPSLMQLARDGDIRATAAASFIQSICQAESTRGRPNMKAPPMSVYYKDLPDTWAPFVDRLGDIFHEDHEKRVDHCADIGGLPDKAEMFVDLLLRPGNVDVDVEIANSNDNQAQAISDLRALVAEHDNARGRFLLGDRLFRSQDAAEHTEGRQLLEGAAVDNPEAAVTLGVCLKTGCGGFPTDPAASQTWFEQAAALGDTTGLIELEKTLAANGENAAAWAWSLFALDLALDGCFETLYASHMNVAWAAQEEARRKAVLTPAEQNAGLAISYAIAGRSERLAKERLSCE